MDLEFNIDGNQIDGARDYQEDAFLVTQLKDDAGNPSALVIVADGMGGHKAGNVASIMAVQGFNKKFASSYPTDKIADILHDCIVEANNAIKSTVAESDQLAGMGCTMVAAVFEKNKMWWVSVGDSHIYLLHERELIKKNDDHSYGGFLKRMKAEGLEVERDPSLSLNMLMSALTGEDIPEIDVSVTPMALEPGDKIIVATDGLDTLSEGKIMQFTDWADTPKEATDSLLQAVTDTGKPKQDNTTVVVIEVTEDTRAAAAPARALKKELGDTQEFPAVAAAADDLSDTTQPREQMEAAAKTTVKLVFPLALFIFPALLVVVLGPALIRLLMTTAF